MPDGGFTKQSGLGSSTSAHALQAKLPFESQPRVRRNKMQQGFKDHRQDSVVFANTTNCLLARQDDFTAASPTKKSVIGLELPGQLQVNPLVGPPLDAIPECADHAKPVYALSGQASNLKLGFGGKEVPCDAHEDGLVEQRALSDISGRMLHEHEQKANRQSALDTTAMSSLQIDASVQL